MSQCNFSSFWLTVTFSSFLITFVACSLRELQNVFVQSFSRYKPCLISISSKALIADNEYPQGICSPTFVVEDFFHLFAHFQSKIQG